MKVKYKFLLSLILAIVWAQISIFLAKSWISELTQTINLLIQSQFTSYLVSVFLIYGIAIIPGFMNAFIVMSLLLDDRPKRRQFHKSKYPDVSIIVAAYNEAKNIRSTIQSIAKQHYPGHIRVIVANDGSTDKTALITRGLMKHYSWLQLISLEKNMGKSYALNKSLQIITTKLTITIDGDSSLHPNALKHIIQRYLSDPDHTAAVAGSILLANSTVNLVTRTQAWDYSIGIAATKRFQSFYHGTLVAQGAFSLYQTEVIREVGKWPHCVGQDIVLTWAILKQGYRIGHAEDAILFTNAPQTWKQFIRQRKRWSRGLVEAFKQHWELLFHFRLTTLFIWWNLIFPYLDIAYTFGFLPGIIFALFGYYWLAGPLTLILIPFAFFLNLIMFYQQRSIIKREKIKVEQNSIGFCFYILFYSAILQPSCVYGYFQELFRGSIKNWGTK